MTEANTSMRWVHFKEDMNQAKDCGIRFTQTLHKAKMNEKVKNVIKFAMITVTMS